MEKKSRIKMSVMLFLLIASAGLLGFSSSSGDELSPAAVEATLKRWHTTSPVVDFRGVWRTDETSAKAYYVVDHEGSGKEYETEAQIIYLEDDGWYIHWARRTETTRTWNNIFEKIELEPVAPEQ